MSQSRLILFKAIVGHHHDHRRAIDDFVVPMDVEIPFTVRQVKDVAMTDEAVQGRLVVGNHFHTPESNRRELFVATGPEKTALFRARFREAGGEIQEFTLYRGDSCIVLPTVSHAFIPLCSGVVLRGLSNLPYDAAHDVPDKLF